MTRDAFASFGTVLKGFRTRRGLTQQTLAEKLGVRRNTLGSWERGDFLPQSRGLVLELARYLYLDDAEIRLLLDASLMLAPHWLVPLSRNPYFTGRAEILETLHAQLGASQTVALTQSSALHGLGGIGKTQTALEYAYRHALEYSAVFWIGAETDEQVIASLLRIAEVLQLPERKDEDQQRVIAAVQHWLSAHGQWLLIWDNVEDLTLLDRFLPTTRSGAILLTTRRQMLGTYARDLDLAPLEQEEGILFLLRRAKVLALEAIGEQMQQIAERMPTLYAAAADLVTELGGLPLALDQAGAYLEETQCGLSAYLDLFLARRVALLQRRGNGSRDHPASVSTTFALAIAAIAERHPAVRDLLQVCALLQPDAIPEEIFHQGGKYLGVALSTVGDDALEWDRVIGLACSYSLLARQPEAQTLSMHRLVQAVLKDRMDAATMRFWIEHVLQALNATCPQPDMTNWPQCERHVPHAHVSLQVLEQTGSSLLEAAQFFYKIGDYLLKRGRYIEAEPFLLHTLAVYDQQDLSPSEVATVLEDLGEIYWALNKNEQALPVVERALALCKKQLGTEHPRTADNYNNVATLYWNLGRYQEAKDLWERALAIHEQCLGPEHIKVAEDLNNIAFVLRDQGNYQQAEPFYQRVLTIRERQLGVDHPQTARVLVSLGITQREMGKYEQAEWLFQQALVTFEQHRYPSTADAVKALGILYQMQSRYEQAEPLLQRALALHEQLLGPEHNHTVDSLICLGTLYQEQGKGEQAEALLQRAETLAEFYQGAYLSRLAHCLMSQGALWRDRGEYKRAEALLQRALAIFEQQDGRDHPRTAHCLANLAETCAKQGKEVQAESLLRRAYRILSEKLGQTHPETLKARDNYRSLFERISDEQEEAAFEQHAGLLQQEKDDSLPSTNDPLQAFLDTCCELHPRAWCRSADLWQAYEHWVKDYQERYPLSRGAFIAQLKAHGCRADRTMTARIWRGIVMVKKES